MHAIRGKVCSICGDRVFSAYAESDPQGLRRCPVCRRLKRPFDRSVAYVSYESGLRELIHLLKYNGVRPAATVLGRMLAEALIRLEPAFERLTFEQAPVLVIPVPLYKAKKRQRGFNQAELIARAALKFQSASTRLQLAPDLLLRTRDTASQIGLSNHQRRANLRGAFAVHRRGELTGREVILVDDVYTTGATATECAQVLRRAGASKVWVATVARTQKLASNCEQFRPDTDEENAASTLADDKEEGQKVTVAHAAGS
jgi:ComF family protein